MLRRKFRDRSRYHRIQALRKWRDQLLATDNRGRAFHILSERSTVNHSWGGCRLSRACLTAWDGADFTGYDYDNVEALKLAGIKLYHYLRKQC